MLDFRSDPWFVWRIDFHSFHREISINFRQNSMVEGGGFFISIGCFIHLLPWMSSNLPAKIAQARLPYGCTTGLVHWADLNCVFGLQRTQLWSLELTGGRISGFKYTDFMFVIIMSRMASPLVLFWTIWQSLLSRQMSWTLRWLKSNIWVLSSKQVKWGY